MVDAGAFRMPMLSATVMDDEFSKLRFPLLASPKIDGIRCVCHPTLGPVTRTLKPIPNNHIRKILSDPLLHYLDGEIVVGDNPYAEGIFNKTQSAVMSAAGEPVFKYMVFDSIPDPIACPFQVRLQNAQDRITKYYTAGPERPLAAQVIYVSHPRLDYLLELDNYEAECIEMGAEGVMLRDPLGRYKYNRSTFKEGLLMKVKRFVDSEAIIVGWVPLERNQNEAFKDERGFQKRSSHNAGKVVDETRVGKFLARGVNGRFKDVEFSCGSGLTDDQRLEYQQRIAELIGKHFTYKYQDHGSLEKPRAPIFKGLRPELD